MFKLKLKPTPRELILLLVLAGLSVGVAWYLLVFAPLNNQLISLKQQLPVSQQKLAERQDWQLRDAQTSEQLNQLVVQRDQLQGQFDPVSQIKDVIDFVSGLITSTNSEITSLEIGPDQVSMAVLSSTYDRAKMVMDSIEKSPNFVISACEIGETAAESGNSYSLTLQASMTWGKRQPDGAEGYIRVTPFGR